MSKRITVSLQPGDPVTVVAGPAAFVHVRYGEDTAVISEHVWADRNEHIRWIRGHHDADSNEVLALLAAWALSGGEEQRKRATQENYRRAYGGQGAFK